MTSFTHVNYFHFRKTRLSSLPAAEARSVQHLPRSWSKSSDQTKLSQVTWSKKTHHWVASMNNSMWLITRSMNKLSRRTRSITFCIWLLFSALLERNTLNWHTMLMWQDAPMLWTLLEIMTVNFMCLLPLLLSVAMWFRKTIHPMTRSCNPKPYMVCLKFSTSCLESTTITNGVSTLDRSDTQELSAVLNSPLMVQQIIQPVSNLYQVILPRYWFLWIGSVHNQLFCSFS